MNKLQEDQDEMEKEVQEKKPLFASRQTFVLPVAKNGSNNVKDLIDLRSLGTQKQPSNWGDLRGKEA
ncbi:hypothetical protein CR513_41956, partial [Mucuna pruriens]